MKKKISFCVIVMMLLFCFPKLALSVCHQHNVQVISPDPSLDVRVMKAYRSGKYVVVDMLFCNVSGKDYDFQIGILDNVSIYDELGNQYVKNVYGKFTKDGEMRTHPKTLLPSEVPVRFTLYISDVEEGVMFLPRIILNSCRAKGGANFNSGILTIKNIMLSE